MVRTKDLFIFISILLLLSIAIAITLATSLFEDPRLRVSLADPIPETNSQPRAFIPETETVQRSDTVARLRALLAEGDVIESSPSVEAPEPVVATSSGVGLACIPPNTGIDIARSWPLENVSLTAVGAERQVVATSPPLSVPVMGSTTVSLTAPTTERVLLSLPAFPTKSAEPICLDSEIIGVTLDGSLMFNTDATLYRTTLPDTLIGYARDGFPIYGAYAGELDACGGYDSSTGYRYSASPAGSSLLGCFSGVPRTFK